MATQRVFPHVQNQTDPKSNAGGHPRMKMSRVDSISDKVRTVDIVVSGTLRNNEISLERRRLSSRPLFFILFVFSIAALFYVILLDFSLTPLFTTGKFSENVLFTSIDRPPDDNKTKLPLNCGHAANVTIQCPSNYYPDRNQIPFPRRQQPICPDYFRWIHEDLRPWRETGITAEMVEAAEALTSANFRLVIVNGTAYVQTYNHSFQTRDIITQWGISQLLRLYPGQVPDLDLIFSCKDLPSVPKKTYPELDDPAPPPLFGYDSSDAAYDIVFPEWSFWGWPEVNIKPWKTLSKELKEGNKRLEWTKREPHAFWNGNPFVHPDSNSMDFLRCNLSDSGSRNARIFIQDFRSPNLASQCHHRFNVYIEGIGWSVSEKYTLACDSLTLLVKPHYYHFFTRSLIPMKHYWPIRDDEDTCISIKKGVDWGIHHPKQAIGERASRFVQEELQMRYVYAYMFHLLTEYAKLLKYKPVVPPGAVQLCSESMACSAEGLMRKNMMDSLVVSPSDAAPCTMPPPRDPAALHSLLRRKENTMKYIKEWEKLYWGYDDLTSFDLED